MWNYCQFLKLAMWIFHEIGHTHVFKHSETSRAMVHISDELGWSLVTHSFYFLIQYATIRTAKLNILPILVLYALFMQTVKLLLLYYVTIHRTVQLLVLVPWYCGLCYCVSWVHCQILPQITFAFGHYHSFTIQEALRGRIYFATDIAAAGCSV